MIYLNNMHIILSYLSPGNNAYSSSSNSEEGRLCKQNNYFLNNES